MKVQELASQADEKQRRIDELERRISTKALATDKADYMRAKKTEPGADALSEFSVATHESTLDTYENILDFKIEEADFYLDAFKQL